MTTAASPTLGGTQGLSLWWVEMRSGAAGPEHVFDSEQVWHLVEGQARIRVGEDVSELMPGDTAVLPAGVVRRITALTALRAVVCGSGTATVSVPGEGASRGTPPWVA
jgi:quercetin dioxygenase-like cupin family protein